jgi:FkbM family methyltransferase
MARDLLRRLLRTVRASPRADVEGLVRWLVARRTTRTGLNLAYNRLAASRKEDVYALFAKIFRGHPRPIADGVWWANVGGRWAALPLGGHDAWLEWDLAVSMLGHELEIKQTYLNLIRLRRPKLFFDIGANYGLHSLVFLLHGVPTVSFEPNPRCHEYFRKLARRNRVRGDIQQVALGAAEGSIEMLFPEQETWLGSTDPDISHRLVETHGSVTRMHVPQTTLDTFTQRDGRRPDLIKIDTEGSEAAILQGARKTLGTCRPWVIFESWRSAGRENLLTLFADLDYKICALPLQLPRSPRVLEWAGLLEWPDTNLIALPSEDVGKPVPVL